MDMLTDLFTIIEDRAKNRVEGSYTNHLQDKGNEKICKKIGEEASEVIIAAIKGDTKECTYEISDLIFHLLVLMQHNGITLNQIEDELKSRHK
jgi:phosphoribosyl-AMP cyclohydrolase / phosphoribosyl-ATP pyrophosphohydrolase